MKIWLIPNRLRPKMDPSMAAGPLSGTLLHMNICCMKTMIFYNSVSWRTFSALGFQSDFQNLPLVKNTQLETPTIFVRKIYETYCQQAIEYYFDAVTTVVSDMTRLEYDVPYFRPH